MEALRKIVPGSALEPLFSLPLSSWELQYEVIILPVSDVLIPESQETCYAGSPARGKIDDGSLEYLFRGYKDDGIREPLADFGEAVGNEQW